MPELNRQSVAAAISSVSKALSAKNFLAAIEGLLCEGDGEAITFAATDLQWTCQARIKQGHIDTFSVILPPETVETIKSLPGETVNIYVANDLSATFSSGRSRYALRGLPAEDFPRLNRDEAASAFVSVSGATLKTALAKVLPAASRDEHKTTFRSVLFTVKDGALSLCATDGFRLAQVSVPVKNDGTGTYLVPAKPLGEIAKILPAGDVQIEFGAKSVLFQAAELACSVRLLDEKYPDIARHFSSSFTSTISVDTGEMLAAVLRASIFAKDMTLTLKAEPGEINLTASAAVGRADETVAVTEQTGEPLNITLNARFLTDALKAVSGATCTISRNGASLFLQDSSDSGFRYLIMLIQKQN